MPDPCIDALSATPISVTSGECPSVPVPDYRINVWVPPQEPARDVDMWSILFLVRRRRTMSQGGAVDVGNDYS